MPEIASPNSFGMEALDELTQDGFNAVTHMGQIAWIGLFLVFGRFGGSQEVESKALQTLGKFGFPVIAISQNLTGHTLQYFFRPIGVGQMRGSQGTIHQDTRPG